MLPNAVSQIYSDLFWYRYVALVLAMRKHRLQSTADTLSGDPVASERSNAP